MERIFLFTLWILGVSVSFSSSCDDEIQLPDPLQLMKISIGEVILNLNGSMENVPVDKEIAIEFSAALDINSVKNAVVLKDGSSQVVDCSLDFSGEGKVILMNPINSLNHNQSYVLIITDQVTGQNGGSFEGTEIGFTTENGILKVESIFINGIALTSSLPAMNVNRESVHITINFNDSIKEDNYKSCFSISGSNSLETNISSDKKTITAELVQELEGYTKYYFYISDNLTSIHNYEFDGFTGSFITSLDSTDKFPRISDDALLDLIQQQTFKYFWDFAHPVSGMIRERNTSGDIVTSGGTGFGLMALIVGVERNFITRTEGVERLQKILGYLEASERFHGSWPHWLNGSSGDAVPFSTFDNGGDIVETAYLIMGLLTFRQYLDSTNVTERNLIDRINDLWQSVEWNWYTKGGENVLYWHWSPDYFWKMNLPVKGYNEALITYILAASSPAYSIDRAVYVNGWAGNGEIINGNFYYDIELPLGESYGGPMFYSHYTYLGVDPGNLSDAYADYWKQSVAHALINHAYCEANPQGHMGYSSVCWGLTASDNHAGYSAHSPTNDLGVITPSAAVSSLPFVPGEAMDAIRHFYYKLGDRLWGEYGFYDAFNVSENWWADSYIAIDQGPIIIMIENYRSGLLWDLFMSCPEIREGLDKLEFNYE